MVYLVYIAVGNSVYWGMAYAGTNIAYILLRNVFHFRIVMFIC